jgi:hypothetical protein
MEFLCEFNFEIKHIKGKQNKVVDALNKKMHATIVSIFKLNLKMRVIDSLVEDEHYVQVKDGLQRDKLEKKYEGYQLNDDGLLIYKNRMYIPNSLELRRIIMDEIHKMSYFRHSGYQKTITATIKQYFWIGMKKDVNKYIVRCMECQQASSINIEHVFYNFSHF